MFDDKVLEIVKKYPDKAFILELARDGIVAITNTEKYKNDPEILHISGDSGMSKQFFIDIISNDSSYDKIKQIYENGLYGVCSFLADEDGEFVAQQNFDRMNVVRFARQVLDVDSIKDRCKQLIDYVSYNKFKEKQSRSTYETQIDGKNYRFSVRSILEFMEMDSSNFDRIISTQSFYGGVPIDKYLYAVKKYFGEKKILENYEIDDSTREKIEYKLEEINSCKKVDIEALNTFLELDDVLFDKIKVDKKLKNYFLSGIPKEFTDIEKAIYLYIKMCKALTYDEEYYAVNQKGPFSEKHKNINYIPRITLENNKVVCYEFISIFSKLLNELGINYKTLISVKDVNREYYLDDEIFKYSEGHEYLKFRCGKHIVRADAVVTMLDGDMVNAKLNQPLCGLTCENKNEQTVEEFYKTLTKVYKYIADREPKITQNNVENFETFDDIVREFIGTTDKLEAVSLKDKVAILISKVQNTRLVGVDAYSYLLQLRRVLFTNEEQEKNVMITITRNIEGNSAKALAVITIKEFDKDEIPSINQYTFKPGVGLTQTNYEELQAMFNKGTMGYITENDPKIPGVRL